MKRFKSFAVLAIALLLGIVALAPAAPVAAQSADSASLSIVPKKNYLIEPGKDVKDTLLIRNLDSQNALQLSLRVVDFTFTDNGGTPKLFLATDAPQTTWSLIPYTTVPKSVTIPAGGSKSVDIRVAIPAGHGAGSFYSAIIYGTGANDGGNVGLSASGVTLVFTTIPGQVTEDLKLKKLGAYDNTIKEDKKAYKYFNEKMPLSVGYTLQNNGNVTEAPVGTIKLKDVFGRETAINEVNPSGSLALIGQTRTYVACIKLASQQVDFGGSRTDATTCVNPGLWPGYYKVSLDVFYGQNGNNTQEVTGVASFWYLPMWFVVAVIILLLLLAFIIWRIVVKIRSALYGPRYKKSSLRRRR